MSNSSSESIAIPEDHGTSLWQDAWIKLSKNRLALFGLAVLITLILVSLLTPLIAPYGYEEQNLDLGATALHFNIGWEQISSAEICSPELCMVAACR